MKPILLAVLLSAFTATSVMAAGDHAGGHHDYRFGEPGDPNAIDRTIKVEANDDMRFVMDLHEIQQGETIEFVVTNKGSIQHEFSIGDTGSQRAHANLMAKNPQMKHEGDPSAVTLAPGETGRLVWTFSKPVQGDIVFACQTPGHYEAGMLHKARLNKK